MVPSVFDALRPGTDSRPQDAIAGTRVRGLVVVLVGISQVPVAYATALPEHAMFVVLSGSGLLTTVGIDLLRQRPPLESRWADSGRYGWLGRTILAVMTLLVVAASASTLLLG